MFHSHLLNILINEKKMYQSALHFYLKLQAKDFLAKLILKS